MAEIGAAARRAESWRKAIEAARRIARRSSCERGERSEYSTTTRVLVVGDIEFVDDVICECGALGYDGELCNEECVVVVLQELVVESFGIERGQA